MADSWLKGKKVEEVTYSGGTFDSDGRKLTPSGGGGSVATDSIFTAKGDLPVGTGASTAQKLAVGANDYVLTADSTQTTGIKWATNYAPGGTDVAVADGGTGASTAAGAATNLGLGTGDSPQFTAVNIGHASDTTVARVSAGVISVEGSTIYAGSNVPFYLIDRQTATSNQTSTATSAATAVTKLTSGSITVDGSTSIAVIMSCRDAYASGGGTPIVELFQGSTDLGILLRGNNTSAAPITLFRWVVLTPAAGSYTYTARLWVSAAGTATIEAGTDDPFYMEIRRSS